MDTKLHSHIVIEKLIDFIGWLTLGRRQIAPARTMDPLYAEIYRLKKILTNAPTWSAYTAHSKPNPLEAVTEQQKIIDLAG